MEDKKNKTEWNDKLEHVVLDIGFTSMAYKIMHITVAQQATKQYSRYMLAGIVVGPLSGIISGIGVAINSSYVSFQIIATILGFLSGIIVAIIKFNKFDEVINSNKDAAAKYTSLESNIRRQLAVYRNNRISAGPYLEWLSDTYENLFSSAPLLPISVQDAYLENANRKGINLPSIYSNDIDVNSEYNTTTTINVKKSVTPTLLIDSAGSKPYVSESEPSPDTIVSKSSYTKSDTVSDNFTDGQMKYQMNRMGSLEEWK